MTTHTPSVRSANWLYLLSMALILSLGSYWQTLSFSWGLLATELALILLPALLFMWRGRLAAPAVLRLRWPGLRLVVLGAVVGAGVWGFDMALQGVATTVLGYAPRSAMASLPGDPLHLVVFAVALAVAAPLCEEVFFRGYLLSAYGRYGPRVALLAVGLLFAFFHLQFQGLLPLLPIALVLGYLAQRSQSLAPAIAAHAANNSLSAAVTIALMPDPALAGGPAFLIVLGGAMLIGPLAALVALWAFVRLTRPAPAPAAPSAPLAVTVPPVARGAFWPLVGAAGLYVLCAGLELTLGRFPAVLAERTLRLEPAAWVQPLHLSYNLWNVANQPVGQAECTLTPQGGAVAFACETRQRHFEVQQDQSYYAGGEYELRQSGLWEAATMRLLEAELQFVGEYGGWSARVGPGPQASPGLSLWRGEAAPVLLPADAVLAAEWPLRMMALPFGQQAYWGSHFSQVMLGVGVETGEVEEVVILLRGEETLLTPPSGQAQAWKVAVGQQTAWYAAQPPHTLLRYNDGYGVTWTVDLDSLLAGEE